MKYVSLFSGIEAASVAWRPLGWEPVAFSEIEAFPSAVLAARYPRVPNLGDITKIDWSAHDDCHTADLVVGGSPCQSFSIAGRREGLEGASGLMWEYVRAIQAIRPQWLVWENVPGALSSSGGEDFRCLLQALDGLGYGLAWRVLDAQYFGVAQRRRRVFLVGSLGSTRACEVLFEPESLRWDHPTGRAKRQALAKAAGDSARDADADTGCLTPWDSQSRRVYDQDGCWPTLDTRERSGGDGRAVVLDFNPTAARLRYADEDVSQTMTARKGTGGNQVPLIQEVTAFLPNAGGKAGSISYERELSPTLKTEHNPAVLCASNRGPRSSIGEDVAPSLMASDDKNPNVVLCATDSTANASIGEGFAPTLTAHVAKNAGYVFSPKNAATAGLSVSRDTSPTLSTTKQPAVSGGGMVRRLMPVECERLQGFPDSWTDVPYKGKDHAPDSPRYKALGNSMAVPVMAWIGRRIQQVGVPPAKTEIKTMWHLSGVAGEKRKHEHSRRNRKNSMNEEIECPYCGECDEFESTDLHGDGPYWQECSHCGRKFEYTVDWDPSITSYRYQGRTERQHAGDVYPSKCSICRGPLEPDKFHSKCPICDAVVCDKCERLKKTCCDEYARWVDETKETV